MSTIKIEKLGEELPKPKELTKPKELPKEGGRKLKSILKKTSKLNLKGVRDPAKTKHTLKLLTMKGHRRRDKTMKRKIGGLTDQKVKELTSKSGLVKHPEMPVDLQRKVLHHALHAGFISL